MAGQDAVGFEGTKAGIGDDRQRLTQQWRETEVGAQTCQLGPATCPRPTRLASILAMVPFPDRVTARIYAHSQDDALKAAAQALGGVVTLS